MLNYSNVMWYWYISFMFCLPWLFVVSLIMLSEWSTQTQMVVRFQTSANANIKENCLTGYLCSLLFVWYELFVIDLKAFINSPSGKKLSFFTHWFECTRGRFPGFPNLFKAHGFWFGILLFLPGKGRATYLVAGLLFIP